MRGRGWPWSRQHQPVGRWAVALVCWVTCSCGDSGEAANTAKLAAADTSSAATDGLTGGDATADGLAAGADDVEQVDAAVLPDAEPAGDGGTTPDASADDGATAGDGAAADQTTSDAQAAADAAGAADGGADVPPPADPCPGCLITSQPPLPHPGAKGPLALAAAETIGYGKGFQESYKSMLVLRPSAPGVYPTVLFVHGKQLYEGGGFPGQLGQPYRAFLEHIASHGYVVAFVRVESGLLDADHLAMADRLLAASKVLADKVSLSDPAKVAYVGHSMGAKVALLAAWRATAGDGANAFPDPAAVFAFAVSNEPPPIGNFENALDKVKLIPASAPTWFTLATADDDTIAPWNDPKKPNAAALYAALATTQKQLLVVHGSGKDDPNPPTSPELVDDHSAPLSLVGKVGGVAGFATPPSFLDALDWYGFWKWTVGGLNFHFKKGDPTWAYGDLRGHGGKTAQGTVHQHTVQQQGWTVLPQP
jgi:hypothetical protein